MTLRKSDLYSSLWKSCDELRGGMDASQYKDYILTLLFVKYVSDKAKADKNSLIDVPTGGSFDDMIGETDWLGSRVASARATKAPRSALRCRCGPLHDGSECGMVRGQSSGRCMYRFPPHATLS